MYIQLELLHTKLESAQLIQICFNFPKNNMFIEKANVLNAFHFESCSMDCAWSVFVTISFCFLFIEFDESNVSQHEMGLFGLELIFSQIFILSIRKFYANHIESLKNCKFYGSSGMKNNNN